VRETSLSESERERERQRETLEVSFFF